MSLKQLKVMNKEETPEIGTEKLKAGMVLVPYVLINPPYMILTDKHDTRKIWNKNKKKIILWYLYKITKIEWFIKKYNE